VLVGTIAFACALGGALAGHGLRAILPAHYLSDESKDTIKLGTGLVATMTALVLGLVTASAKSSFDSVDTAVRHAAMDILTLDRLLARYGPETGETRAALKRSLAGRLETLWPQASDRPAQLDPIRSGAAAGTEALAESIRALEPRDDSQRYLQSHALERTEELLEVRWGVFALGGRSVPLPFLVVLLFWLTITFASFGLFAPRNAMLFGVLFVCALSVGSAVFLILELDSPFDGLLRVSPEPLRYALSHLEGS
jgi:hypothetical protein